MTTTTMEAPTMAVDVAEIITATVALAGLWRRAALGVNTRRSVREHLNRRRAQRQAGAWLAEYRAEEASTEAEARAELAASGRVTLADAEERRARRELIAAKRHDAYKRALDIPMSGNELRDVCQHATLAAKVKPEFFEDVSQSLALVVIRRHGAQPSRANVAAGWLKQWAQRLAQRESETHERVTGMRAAAKELAEWQKADKRAAAELMASNGGDAVWAIAAGRPAPNPERDVATAERIAQTLPALSYLQRDAVRIALATDRTRPLSDSERQLWSRATALLRKRFHTADSVRCAIRHDLYSAELLADAAIRLERKRANVTSRGGSGAIQCAR
jgi:hypothetical protein